MKLKVLDNPFQYIYKLKLRQRVAAGIAILALFGYFVYNVFISPQLLNLKAVHRQFLAQKNLIQAKKDKARQLLLLEERYNQLQAELINGNRRFFSDEEAIDFLKELNELVENQTGNDLVLIRPLFESTLSESLLEESNYLYKRQDLEITVRGQFATILELIQELYTADKLLSIKEVEIEVEQEALLLLRVDFILSLYLLSQGATAGGVQ